MTLDLVNYILPPSMGLEFSALNLDPGNSTIHTVMFLPTEVGPCVGSLTFLMNESITKTVTLRGEGVAMHVKVPARQRHLQFNGCVVGKLSTLTVETENRSKVEVTGKLVLTHRPGMMQLKSLLDEKVLYVSPGSLIQVHLP